MSPRVEEPAMEPDAIDIRRIDVGSDMEVWVSVKPTAAEPSAPAEDSSAPALARAWRVHPAGVALGAVLAAAALLRLGVTPAGVLSAGVLAVLGVLTVIDLQVRLLPNRIIVPTLAAVLAWQLVFLPERFVEAVVAGIAAAGFLWLPSLIRPGAMGLGDVKLAGLLGAALGAPVALALVIGSFAAWPVALAMVVRKRAVRGATIPLGPFLAVGAAAVLLA
jgi:leader peptidase (prepilin peptidase) / N-methyltransferase